MIEPDELTWLNGVQAAVGTAIEVRRPESFATLLEELPGLPPESALLALHQLRVAGCFVNEVDDLLSSATNPIHHLNDPIETVFLRPHPLDYEWRFDRATRRSLCSELIRIAGSEGHIVSLGCPTVAYELVKSSPRTQITLIDANPGLPTLSSSFGYRQVPANLLKGAPQGIPTADVVIADPPFYLRHIEAFLVAASSVMHEGSLLLMTLPAERTRPTAREDISTAIARAQSACLEWTEVRSGGVRYLRPRFERLAHEAKGIFGVPDDWRVADLHVFKRNDGEVPATRMSDCTNDEWVEVVIGPSRIRIRIDDAYERTADSGPRLLNEILPGDVLDSVSGRDPRRCIANVWTDGNVVWHTQQPSLVLAILKAVSCGKDPLDAAFAAFRNRDVLADPAGFISAVNALVERVRLLG